MADVAGGSAEMGNVVENACNNNWLGVYERDSDATLFDTQYDNGNIIMFVVDADVYVPRSAVTIASGSSYKLYHNPTKTSDGYIELGGSGGTSDYNDLTNKPKIDGNDLTKDSTHQSLKLISANDIVTETPVQLQSSDVDIVLTDGQNVDPSIIQDGQDYQYTTNKTSSNNKIWVKWKK